MDNQNRLQDLFNKYLVRLITQPELSELGILLQHADAEEQLQPRMSKLWDKIKEQNIEYPVDWENFYEQVIIEDRPVVVRKIKPIASDWKRWIAAASLILIAGITIWYFISKNEIEDQPVAIMQSDIEAPRITKATITLADGKTITVESLTTLTQGNANIKKTADGKVVYQGLNTQQSAVQYNKFSNPRGSQVQSLTLSDGSKVWLNAGSSLTFPTVFVGNERKIQITGEIYFEVAHDASKPFTVSKGDISIHVLGTHFNVNAYDDEDALKVTLLEGSVKISKSSPLVSGGPIESVVIKPGEQAIAKNNSSLIIDRSPDVEQVMAWKNGWFEFGNTDLQTIIRQISRWYDLDIVYEGKTDAGKFGGRLSKDLPLSNVLKLLEENGVRFKLEGRKLIVNP